MVVQVHNQQHQQKSLTRQLQWHLQQLPSLLLQELVHQSPGQEDQEQHHIQYRFIQALHRICHHLQLSRKHHYQVHQLHHRRHSHLLQQLLYIMEQLLLQLTQVVQLHLQCQLEYYSLVLHQWHLHLLRSLL